MKNFDLEQAKAGKPVCTRDGRKARIICFDAHDKDFPLIALVKREGADVEDVERYTEEGTYYTAQRPSGITLDNKKDLMMAGIKRTGYIALFKSDGDFMACASNVYSSVEKVKEGINWVDDYIADNYIAIVKVEWEE